jgi:hypothetical protein
MIMRPAIRAIVLAALSSALLPIVPAARAQSQPPAETREQAPLPSVSDEKLSATAAAMQHVISIQQDYQKQLSGAPPAEQQRLTSEANKALEKAVTDQGLSVDEYRSIMQVAQNDPVVRQKLMARLQPSAR